MQFEGLYEHRFEGMQKSWKPIPKMKERYSAMYNHRLSTSQKRWHDRWIAKPAKVLK